MSDQGNGDHDRRLRHLSGFLQRTPEVQAILINDQDHTLSVATLGQVDEAQLKLRLAEVMREGLGQIVASDVTRKSHAVDYLTIVGVEYGRI